MPDVARRNTLRSYGELHKRVDLFLQGKMQNHMLIMARPGIGKSFYAKNRADRRITLVMEGNLRPLMTYMELYRHRHKLVLLDDAETLWADRAGRIILRELTETSFPKRISWTSTVSALSKNGIPTAFETNSRVFIICNSFRFGRTEETAAILDRCQCYYFDPSNEEVARYVATWFWDQPVFDYACERVPFIDKLTARMFVKASERRDHGDPNWSDEFPSLQGAEAIVQQVWAGGSFPTAEDRVAEFQRLTAQLPGQSGRPMSRATFMRYQADLKERGQLTLDATMLHLTVNGQRRPIPVGVDAILDDVAKAAGEQADSETCNRQSHAEATSTSEHAVSEQAIGET